ncbi:MAG TPA: glycosyltransferase family 4 protein [Candidatus Didemnitutus sp.]|nr:glycosyltransferase family 4 protein [Candidatus Didemnitutus sp.]
MNPVPDWTFAVDIHPTEWKFPIGPTWVAGWIGTANGSITDVRGWVDGQPHLALHGLPRPGIDERFRPQAGPPYAGFSLLLEPPSGASLFRLEARDQSGGWREYFRTEISSLAQPVTSSRPALAALLPELVPALLRLKARRPHDTFRSLADEVVSGAAAVPLNSLPNPPFYGALEEPRESGWLRYGRLSITGWLAHRHQPITRITAMVDPRQEGALLHGLRRTDVDSLFPDLPGRETSAFLGHVDLPADTPVPALLKVFAELANGEKHLVFARRFTPHVITGADKPLPPRSRATFARAILALRGAAKRLGVSRGSFADFRSAIGAAWDAYSTDAPARKPAASRAGEEPPPVPARPLRVLVATHNLNFEGAPWFVFELARHLAAQPGNSVRIVSPQEGPLRRVFEEAGMPVTVLDLRPALRAESPAAFRTRLGEITGSLPWAETDLLIANTMVTFWAVHAARLAGCPAVMYVHESAAIRRFFEPLLHPTLFGEVEAAFRDADRVVFTAESSRSVFAHLNRRRNFISLPSWVDVGRIDAFVGTSDRDSLRRKHGLDPEAFVVVNIGSVCERKGQHIFIRALEILAPQLPAAHPGKKFQFVMVGARPGLYLESLQQEVRLLGLKDAVFHGETGEVFDYYRLADLFVCSSFEESFPRVLLESAAFRLPIVSTNVNGIAEMLAADEAWLIPAGDRYRMAEAMRAAIDALLAGDRSRPDKARESIVARYHEARSLPRHHQVALRAAR